MTTAAHWAMVVLLVFVVWTIGGFAVALAFLRTFGFKVRDERGQALIEYALIISLIALVAIVALQTSGVNVSSLIHRVGGDL